MTLEWVFAPKIGPKGGSKTTCTKFLPTPLQILKQALPARLEPILGRLGQGYQALHLRGARHYPHLYLSVRGGLGRLVKLLITPAPQWGPSTVPKGDSPLLAPLRGRRIGPPPQTAYHTCTSTGPSTAPEGDSSLVLAAYPSRHDLGRRYCVRGSLCTARALRATFRLCSP